jgi:diguanylate cyclase (GGDEF)-like protein
VKSNSQLPSAHILIVDDESAVRNLLCAILQDNYACTTAESAEEALRLIGDVRFDVIISDIHMAGMSGIELISRVLGLSPDAVVMVISGSTSIDSAIEAIRSGAFDYLKKPFDAEQVELAVDRAVAHAALIAAQRKYETDLERLVEERTARLNYLAFHDALTDLYNRGSFERRLTTALEGDAGRVSVVFVSLDNFKALRDGFGHSFGDRLLREVGSRLANVSDRVTVARFEGDEFALLVKDTDHDAVSAFVQKVFEIFSAPFKVDEYEVFVSVSIGVAMSDAAHNAQVLLRNAGAALSHARQLGGNNFQFYSSDINLRAIRRLELENDLRRALDRGEIGLHYHPILNTNTRKIVGAEALVRWNHPKLGPVPPIDFIPLAESIGSINPIGEWILESACRQTKHWHEQGFPIEIAVNLSPRQFQQHDLERKIREILEKTGLVPSYLNLEVTESSIMNNADAAVSILRGLRNAGVKISIDDFGTGYSSLGYLQKLPIDILKIDKSFVSDVSANPDDAALIITIISLAHNLRLRVVAEGVETEEQLKFLHLMKCDEWQGYFYSRPVNADAFESLLIASNVKD